MHGLGGVVNLRVSARVSHLQMKVGACGDQMEDNKYTSDRFASGRYKTGFLLYCAMQTDSRKRIDGG